VQSLSATSAAGVLLDLSGVVILLLAFACLASKLFNRYVVYYGAQSRCSRSRRGPPLPPSTVPSCGSSPSSRSR
jgi:hypothetical protein